MKESRLILASGSPRRRELLEGAGYAFDVVTSDAPESAGGDSSPDQTARSNAEAKALAVAATQDPEDIVLGADTIVVLDGVIFGKPKDASEARAMLEALSGKTHQVITGVCIVHEGAARSFAETTHVTFRPLTESEIASYVATGEPLDKAGAYGIQGLGGKLVDHIEGDYDNVVGLPVDRVREALETMGAPAA